MEQINQNLTYGGFFSCRSDSQLTLIGDADSLYEYLGYTKKEFHTQFQNQLMNVIDPVSVEYLKQNLFSCASETRIMNEIKMIAKDGTFKWAWMSFDLLEDNIIKQYYFCMFHDVTKHVLVEKNLSTHYANYETLFAKTQDITYEWNDRSETLSVSKSFKEKFGYDLGDHYESIIEAMPNIIHPNDLEITLASYQRTVKSLQSTTIEMRIKKVDGNYIWVRSLTIPIIGDDGKMERILGLLTDINDDKMRLLLAEESASLDSLTNLYNQRVTNNLITDYLESSKLPAALIAIDVDNFKEVNDTLGHIYGDALLSDMAFNLRNNFPDEIVGRVGGDEFVVFITHLTNKESLEQSLENILAVFKRSFADHDIHYDVSCSVGISIFPNDGEDYKTLFKKADMAMYKSKNLGKNQYTFYDNSIQNIEYTNKVPIIAKEKCQLSEALRENAVNFIFKIFMENRDINVSIPAVLDIIGVLFEADRVSIYELNHEENVYDLSFEWHSDYLTDLSAELKRVEYRPIEFQDTLQNTLIFNDVSKMSEGRTKEWFDERQTKTVLLSYVVYEQQCTAFIAFECCQKVKPIKKTTQETLSLLIKSIDVFLSDARKQEELVNRDRILQALLNQMNASVYLVDPDNYEMLILSQNETDQVILTDHETCYHALQGKDKPCEDCPMRKVFETRKTQTRGVYIQRLERYVDTTASIFKWKNQKEMCLFAIYDVDEYIKHNTWLEVVNECFDGGVLSTYNNKEWICCYMNQTLLDYLGYVDENDFKKHTQNKLTSCIHPDDLSIVDTIDEQIKRSQKYEEEYRLIKKDGSTLWVHSIGKMLSIPNGKEVIISTFSDVTEKVELLNEYQKIIDNYQIITKGLDVSIWEYDIVHKRIIFSESTNRLHGNDGILEKLPESLIHSGVIHPNSLDAALNLLKRLDAGEPVVKEQLLLYNQFSNECFWQDITCTTIYNEFQQPIRAIAIGLDITQRKQMEARYLDNVFANFDVKKGYIMSFRGNITKNSLAYFQSNNQTIVPKNKLSTFEHVVNTAAKEMSNANDRERFASFLSKQNLIASFEENQRLLTFDYRRVDQEGMIRWARCMLKLIKENNSEDIYGFGTIQDINQKKTIELSLSAHAEFDPLLHVYNKETAVQMIEQAICNEQETRPESCLIVLRLSNYIDIIRSGGYKLIESVLAESVTLVNDYFNHTFLIMGRFLDNEMIIYTHSPSDKTYTSCQEIIQKLTQMFKFKYSMLIKVAIVNKNDHFTNFNQIYQAAKLTLNSTRINEESCLVYNETMNQMNTHSQLETFGLTNDDSNNRLLQDIFLLSSTENLKDSIEPSLTDVARHYQAEDVYIITTDQKMVVDCYMSKENKLSDNEIRKMYMHLFADPEFTNKTLPLIQSDSFIDDCNVIKEASTALYEMMQQYHVNSLYAFPIILSNELFGMMCVHNAKQNFNNHHFSETLRYFIASEFNKRKIAFEQKYASEYDLLTGMLNRNSFLKFKNSFNADAIISLGVACLDLNGLKTVNERYGADYGDRILIDIANEIKVHFVGDFAYRFSGDEFLIISKNTTNQSFIQKIQDTKATLLKLYPNLVSFGWVWADEDVNLDLLMTLADNKMMISKRDYYKHEQVYHQQSSPPTLNALISELQAGKYQIFLQPKIDLKKHSVVHAEALIRYIDNGMIVPPSEFIFRFEKQGIIRYIDLFVFEEVCKLLTRWKEEGQPLFTIALNFSRITLVEENLVDIMEEIRMRYGVEAKYLEIEITEGVGELQKETVAQITQQIVAKGYRMALDDFGAKYSNLAMLSYIDLQVIKLDKSLINDLISNKKIKKIIQSFIKLCKTMKIETVAEGVETVEQVHLLESLNCDFAQGYYFNKPISISTFESTYLSGGGLLR